MTPFHQKRPSHKLLCCTCTLPNMYLPNPKYVSAKYVNAKSQILNLQNMHTFAQYLSANHTPSQFKHIRKTCFCLVLAKRSSQSPPSCFTQSNPQEEGKQRTHSIRNGLKKEMKVRIYLEIKIENIKRQIYIRRQITGSGNHDSTQEIFLALTSASTIRSVLISSSCFLSILSNCSITSSSLT